MVEKIVMTKVLRGLVLSILLALFLPDTSARAGIVVKNVVAEGSCAIVGMSAEQSQFMALQRARTTAIERAAGVNVSSSTIVTDLRLAADFIKTYTRGFVIREKAEWLPLGQYQKDISTAPIPEYRVRIIADVSVPQKRIASLGLKVKTNASVYRSGEKAALEITTAKPAQVAVFNITPDDRIVLLFPHDQEKRNLLPKGGTIRFPAPDSPIELEMQTLPGHTRDAEAFFIVAMEPQGEAGFLHYFKSNEPMEMCQFFARYAEIADFCEDAIAAYEVVQ